MSCPCRFTCCACLALLLPEGSHSVIHQLIQFSMAPLSRSVPTSASRQNKCRLDLISVSWCLVSSDMEPSGKKQGG
ncbi:hypothetical protein EDB86DRAFT_2919493 [Lactarius hatsudake]|nr:hypothetical protein EDB86DRAFT_2992563 [Lactarius hatsudake]KAH8996095.1 hypothetical protein EDB86DRAFT_2919493 [Lactarius hatsudake]